MTAWGKRKHDQVRCALAAAADTDLTTDVPVGAALFDPHGKMVATGHNTRDSAKDYAGHAEIMALNAGYRLVNNRVLTGYTLAITLEPCAMCAGAILASRVSRVVFGAWDTKAGAAGSVYDLLRDGLLPYPSPEVIGGVASAECAALLQDSFAQKR